MRDDSASEHRAADDERHEDRAARPQHLAQRQVEDARRRRAERHDGRRGHCFTRYLKTACRLSSGDVTSSMTPASPDAAMLRQPRVERVGPRRLDDDRARLEPQADDTVLGQERARQRPRIVGAHEDRVRMRVDQLADLSARCLRRGSGRC